MQIYVLVELRASSILFLLCIFILPKIVDCIIFMYIYRVRTYAVSQTLVDLTIFSASFEYCNKTFF